MTMPKILATKKLKPPHKNLLLQAGVSLVEYDAIQIQIPFLHNLPDGSQNAIFTSKNAVRAVSGKVKVERAFCVGEKTKKFLQDSGVQVEIQAANAELLAQKICTEFPDISFDFFCGNLRKENLAR